MENLLKQENQKYRRFLFEMFIIGAFKTTETIIIKLKLKELACLFVIKLLLISKKFQPKCK
jgi:hypothetical protein